MCVNLYIHSKYTQFTDILYKQKLILDVINAYVKQKCIYIYVCVHMDNIKIM